MLQVHPAEAPYASWQVVQVVAVALVEVLEALVYVWGNILV